MPSVYAPGRTPMNAEEVERRSSRTDLVEELFRRRPETWISVPELVDVGGLCGWRTRVADARQRIEQAGDGTIVWNRNVRASAYRFVLVKPVDRPAEGFAQQATLF
jgi:hypothetical protein